MKTRVVNLRTTVCPENIYIGRPSSFGNPFKIGRDGNRSEVIEKFTDYFYERIKTDHEFRQKVEKLKGHNLGCYCKPEACHGDVIAQYLDWKGDDHSTGVNCGRCGAVMELEGIDVYKCLRCMKVIDMGEDNDCSNFG